MPLIIKIILGLIVLAIVVAVLLGLGAIVLIKCLNEHSDDAEESWIG